MSPEIVCDVAVVGAGPAGMAAAAAAASANGSRVVLLDDNSEVGGQIWRRGCSDPRTLPGSFAAGLQRPNIAVLCGYSVVQVQANESLLFSQTNDGAPQRVRFRKLILATGARERYLPFPGWTLPHVIGAGGLQALVKSGLPIAGKRVMLAGTGPLLLPVAAYLKKHGATVLAICEQASRGALLRFGTAVLRRRSKWQQALRLFADLRSIPFWPNAYVVRAEGFFVTIRRNGREREIPCDYLATGFHLVPNSELAVGIGCDVRHGFVEVDGQGETSVPGVFCVGEPTAIGGVDAAILQGRAAGFAATEQWDKAKRLDRRVRREREFARQLEKAFALRPELRSLPDDETIVCRCEDVRHARLQPFPTWRDAKNQTRCGMGPCQGRICGPAGQFLYRWDSVSIRPPSFPVSLGTLAAIAGDHREPMPVHCEGIGEYQ